MPKLLGKPPTYRKHKSSGQAVVTLSGRDHYLGPWGTAVSRREYDRVVSDWLANGRKPPEPACESGLTIIELAAKYLEWATPYYAKHGRATDSIARIKVGLQVLIDAFGGIDASRFGPLALKELQQRLIREGTGPGRRPDRARRTLTRKYINDLCGVVRRVFRWGVSEQLVPVAVSQGLATVDNLRLGRSAARETARIVPVADDVFNSTLPFLPPVVVDLVKFIRYTGCRPSEAMLVRPMDVDRSGKVWKYRPSQHKCEHHGHERIVPIGKRTKAALKPYLLRAADSYCFSPAESRRKQLDAARAGRKTKVQPSQQNRRKANPKFRLADKYNRNTLNHAIVRACDKAGVQPWHANQLRHTLATEARKHFGLDAVQATLGHSNAKTSEIYAEVAADLAERVAERCG